MPEADFSLREDLLPSEFGFRISDFAQRAMLEYSRSCLLEAPPEEVFDFHADPRNIIHVSPPGQDAQIRQGAGPARLGAQFEVEITLFGYLPMHWLATWQEVDRPRLLCDIASPALFPHWEHRHEFEPVGVDQTRLTDRVRYALPGGWLGWLAGHTAVRAMFALMFAFRHRQTQAYFRQARPSS